MNEVNKSAIPPPDRVTKLILQVVVVTFVLALIRGIYVGKSISDLPIYLEIPFWSIMLLGAIMLIRYKVRSGHRNPKWLNTFLIIYVLITIIIAIVAFLIYVV